MKYVIVFGLGLGVRRGNATSVRVSGIVGRLLQLSIGLLFLPSFLNAQTVTCGISHATQQQIRQQVKEYQAKAEKPAKFEKSNTVRYVPIKFHLVAKSDGSGRILIRNVLEQLCVLNEQYDTTGIQFYIKWPINFVNSDRLYSSHSSNQTEMARQKDFQALNVWILDDASLGGNILGIVAGYYDTGYDWVVMRKDRIGRNPYILPHEMGHFFSLPHTFNGWDFDPYDPAVHGNPAPAISPDGNETEKQDGSNCKTAGDYFCDTKPDYNLGIGWNTCSFTNIVLDPNRDTINPDERLHMSYFFACPGNRYFSDEQKTVMVTDYNSRKRAYLRVNAHPAVATIDQTPQVLFPGNGDTSRTGTSTNLAWTSVPGATYYLVEVDRIPSFSLSPQQYLTTNPQLELTDLIIGRRYYWRIRPFNAHSACLQPTNSLSFIAAEKATATNTIRGVSDITTFPNPVKSGDPVHISWTQNTENVAGGKNPVQAIRILDAIGRTVYETPWQTLSNNATFHNTNLLPGVYHIVLISKEGQAVKKLVVYD